MAHKAKARTSKPRKPVCVVGPDEAIDACFGLVASAVNTVQRLEVVRKALGDSYGLDRLEVTSIQLACQRAALAALAAVEKIALPAVSK